MRKIETVLLSAVAAVILAAPVSGQTLRWASGFPPASFVSEAIDETAAYISENSDLSVKHFPLSLLKFTETVSGLRDGVVDIGYVLTPYFPAEFSEANLVGDLAMLATTGTPSNAPGLVMAGAMAEYVLLECDECQQQFAAQNQLYLSGGSTTEYTLQCDSPVRSMDEIRNLKVRTGSPNMARFFEELGATKVSIPAVETYEAISSNSIDCSALSVPELLSVRLIEVMKYVTMGVPGGVFANAASANFNLDTWRDLSDEQREVMLRAAAKLTADIGVGYVMNEIEAMEESKAVGIEFLEPDAELQQFIADFVQSDLNIIADQYRADAQIEDVDQKIETITGLIEKWKPLAEPYAEDAEGFATLLWDEVYSKVDPATYGMAQ